MKRALFIVIAAACLCACSGGSGLRTAPTGHGNSDSTSATDAVSSDSTPVPSSSSPRTTVTSVAPTTTAPPTVTYATPGAAATFIESKTIGGDFANLHWAADASAYDPTADLSYVLGNTPQGTGSSPTQVFLFHQGQYLGTATADPRFDLRVDIDGPAALTVQWGHFAAGDPDCCPSLPPFVVHFSWAGQLQHSGQFPSADQH